MLHGGLTHHPEGVNPPWVVGRGASTSPSSTARSIASLRLEASSFLYTEIAWLLTVFRETKSRSAISRNERCVVRSGRSRSSAAVSVDAQPAPTLVTFFS